MEEPSRPWKWRKQVPLEPWWTSGRQRHVTAQSHHCEHLTCHINSLMFTGMWTHGGSHCCHCNILIASDFSHAKSWDFWCENTFIIPALTLFCTAQSYRLFIVYFLSVVPPSNLCPVEGLHGCVSPFDMKWGHGVRCSPCKLSTCLTVLLLLLLLLLVWLYHLFLLFCKVHCTLKNFSKYDWCLYIVLEVPHCQELYMIT
jgi:hypothetical protein